ncbi:UNVERIFIED_CONTAM: protein NRT1/ PTR FAMILY 3.1 [Sesamum calycinum]|uniref:Protein NRT1/ PTR FAMILY 3.1 n=1 Tax=Sesamum calycinum TaxID=2727403 RepID=A0AAW2SW65_9LAMI
MVSDPKILYENEDLDAAISVGGKLVHTKSMKRPPLVPGQGRRSDRGRQPQGPQPLETHHSPPGRRTEIHHPNGPNMGLRHPTHHRLRPTKHLLPTAGQIHGQTSHQKLPNPSSINECLHSGVDAVYHSVLRPHFRPVNAKFTGLERGISFLTRMAIGFFISLLATLAAGFVEVKRKNAALDHGLIDKPHDIIPISVFWLMPQYCLHGMAEAYMSIGHLEFFYDQAPESMRSTGPALFWLSISAGNYTSTLLVTLVHKYSAGADGSNWLPDDNLNKGKLEYLYWLITLLQFFNLIYYLVCAKFYTLKPIQARKLGDDREKEDGVELTSHV